MEYWNQSTLSTGICKNHNFNFYCFPFVIVIESPCQNLKDTMTAGLETAAEIIKFIYLIGMFMVSKKVLCSH